VFDDAVRVEAQPAVKLANMRESSRPEKVSGEKFLVIATEIIRAVPLIQVLSFPAAWGKVGGGLNSDGECAARIW
jgi:hypothetical protein